MDNNNFNNDPNNAGATNNSDYSAPQPSNPYQYSGTSTTDTTAQQNPYGAAQQNPYTTEGTAQQNPYGTAGTTQQNPYGTAGTAQQNPYGTAGTPYNAYGTMNAAPLDKNGQPMKNNFGMKLTFSILEIICCNLLSLIMGILGCVFTTKANTAYKEGRWEDFKSAAKSATIVLWVGFAGVVIMIITSIVVGIMAPSLIKQMSDDTDDSSYDYSYDYDDDDDYTYDYDDSYDDSYTYDDVYVDEPEDTVSYSEDIDFEDTVIYNANNVTITATGITWYDSYDGYQYPEINVVIANGSDRDITVSCEYLSINGIAMSYASIYTNVTAGMNAKDVVDCDFDDVWEYCDFDEIEYFTICMNVYDDDYNDYSETYDFYSIQITDDATVYGPNESFPVIASQNGFDIYYMGTTASDYNTEQFVFFVYNNSDAVYVHFNSTNLAVDGFMQSSSYAYTYLNSGDGGILFVDVDDDVDINNVSSASIQFEAYDAASYDDLLDTDNIAFIQ